MGITNVALAIPAIVVLILLSVALDTRFDRRDGGRDRDHQLALDGTSRTRAGRQRADPGASRRRPAVRRGNLADPRSGTCCRTSCRTSAWRSCCRCPGAILAEAALSLLGLGPSDGVSLGIMLTGRCVGESLRTGAWWAFVPPTLLLTLVAFTLLMLQSSLDEVFNPRLRGGRRRGPGPARGAALAQVGVVADTMAIRCSTRAGRHRRQRRTGHAWTAATRPAAAAPGASHERSARP